MDNQPAQEVPTPRNTVTLSLDGDEDESLLGYRRSQGHFRAWNRSRGIRIDVSNVYGDQREVYTTPPSGTFYYVMRYRGRKLTFVIQGRSGWLVGFYGPNGTYQLELEDQMTPYMNTARCKILSFRGNHRFISGSDPGSTRIGLHSLRAAFDAIWEYAGENPEPSNFRRSIGIIVIFLCEAAKIQDVFDRICRSFTDPSISRLSAESGPESQIGDSCQEWSKLSHEGMKHVHHRIGLNELNGPPIDNRGIQSIVSAEDLLRTIRILHRDAYNEGLFQHEDPPFPPQQWEPIDLGNGDGDSDDENGSNPENDDDDDDDDEGRKGRRKGNDRKYDRRKRGPQRMYKLSSEEKRGAGGEPIEVPERLLNTWSTGPNLSISARNLQPQDLGAVIFGCTNNTIAECHSRQLFGLPRAHISYVQNIKEGLPLFLFNYDDRKLYGVYEAAGNGKFCPESNAWSNDGHRKTSYPAQVAMRVRVWCFPLAENQFRKAIAANFYQNTPSFPGQKLHYFQFELDHAQTRVLMDMFTPSPPNNFWMPPVAALADEHVRELVSSPVWPPKHEGKIESEKVVKSYADMVKKNKFEEVGERDVDAEHASSGDESSNGFDDLDCGRTSPVREYEPSHQAVEMKQQHHSDKQGKVLSFNRVLEGHAALPVQQWNPYLYANATETEDNDAYAQDDKCSILDGHSNLPETLDAEVNQFSLGHSNLLVQLLDSESSAETKLIDVVKELSGCIEMMEKQAWSNKEVQHLQGVNERLLKRIVELKGRARTLNSKIDPLTLDDSLNQFVEQCLCSEDVIYLVGGFDGFSSLPSLDSFSPSLDILTPLKPMAVGKSYASTVALNGKIFVLGGGGGSCWFDTVDCYDRSCDDWISCPSLTCGKGSLAGVSVNGKIYAFGGGDGSQCFSDVEIFDPTHGKWIKNQPMLEKRFALAGVALNGAIYAVGGFNGVQYLSSAERLDPREPNWKMLPMMSAGRGCHTLAVLNEKIFSIGGYDTGAKADAILDVVERYKVVGG